MTIMKKTLAKLLLTTFLSFTFVGCNPTSGNKEHIHQYDVENVEWFWKQLESKDYEARATFTCPDCKEDVEGHSVTINAEVSKTTTRDATCSTDGEYKYTASVTFQGNEYTSFKTRAIHDPDAHHYVEVVDAQYLVSAANCEQDAVYYKSCEHCHEASEETFVDLGSKLGHLLEHHNAKESTCQEHGNKEYYQCSRCLKYFLSEDGEAVGYNEIELPLSHKMTYHEGSEATCTSDGELGYYTCEFEPGVKYYDEAGEHVVESDDDLHVAALGHEFGEDGQCIRCDRILKEEYGLEDPSMFDTLAPTTLSDLNIADETAVTSAHIFSNHNFLENKGIDLWLKYTYTLAPGDSQFFVYLFNQYNEDGPVFRIETSRTENDGIEFGYFIYGGVATRVIFPIDANIKGGQEVTVHIFAYLNDATTNTFTVGYQAGVNEMYNPVLAAGGTGYEKNSPLFTREVQLGASYFNDGLHNLIRISAINNTSVKISSAKALDRKVVLNNEEGEILGVKRFKTDTQFALPSLHKENNQFLGWFDSRGNKQTSLLVDSLYFLTARFVTKQQSMFVPSDAGFNTKDSALVINSDSAVEEYHPLPVSSTSTRNDVYFILETVNRAGTDPYIVFGFPFDATDEMTRIHLRINYNEDLKTLSGYFYGTSKNSLGNVGSTNAFSSSDVGINNTKLLIHLYATSTVAGDLTFTAGAEVTNLSTGASYGIEKEVTSAVNFSTADQTRNMLCFQHIANGVGSEFKVTDAF